MYVPTLVTAPTEQPLTLTEAKKQVEVAGGITHHDDHLQRLIKAATKRAEEHTHRQILTATYDWQLDRLPYGTDRINVPLPPLQSVTSITYDDSVGDSQTLSTDVYKVLPAQHPGQIALKYGQRWPSCYPEAGAVTIRFVAGYADTAAEFNDVEEYMKAGLLIAVQAFWMREHSQPFEKTLLCADGIFETYAPGDEFLDYEVK